MARVSRDQSDVPLRWVYIFFFCSGATGLVYQVLWTRRLTLTFGHTVLAVSTVLTAFMGGLALGSMMAGRWADGREPSYRHSGFLRMYGYLEGFVGLWALLSLYLLTLVEELYIGVSALGFEGASLHLACFLASALVIVPPTAAMGATVPMLARLLVRAHAQVGPILSRLYGLNTLGALAGAAAGGFFLLPALGLMGSMLLAALLNLAVAVGAVRVARLSDRPPDDGQTLGPARGKRPKSMGKRSKSPSSGFAEVPFSEDREWKRELVVMTFGLAGFASMAYQVGWNRAICLSIGSSVYAFSAILVAFLGGLALGSLLYERLMRRRQPTLRYLGWLYFVIGCTGALTVPAMAWLPGAYLSLAPWVGQSFGRALFCQASLVALVLLLPTLVMGLGFPLATAIYTRSMERLGGSVGQVYGANTLGCILGSFVTGFFAIPRFGAEWTLKIASVMYLTVAFLLILVAAQGRQRGFGAVLCLIVTMVALYLPRWDSAVMSSGVVVYANKYLSDEGQVFSLPVFYRDGLSSTVSFHLTGEFWELPNMRVNGKVDASLGEGDRLTQYMLGYLPTLLHPSPKKVAVIGLGGGFTVEAVAQVKQVTSIDVVELEPAVLEAGEFWKPFNDHVLDDPRVEIHLQDGRTFISASQQRYDVIISEPSNPWIAGIGSLFTRDFYLRSREKLNPGGIMCQWFNLYHVSQADTAMVIRTFYDVFPNGSLWQSSGGDLILIGTSSEVPFSLERVQKFWGDSLKVQRNFFLAWIYKPEYFPGHYLMSRDEALQRAGKGSMNTDDRPLLEFSAPLSLYRHGFEDTQRMLWSDLRPSLPPGVEKTPETQSGCLFAVANREDFKTLRQMLEESKEGTSELVALAGRLESADSNGNRDIVPKLFEGSRKKYPEDPLIALFWGDLEYGEGRYAQAAEQYLTALSKPLPGSEAYLCLRVGQCLLALEDPARAVRPLLRAADLEPSESLPLSLLGRALVGMKRDVEAIDFLRVAIKRNPSDPLAHEYLGYALFNAGKFIEARSSLERLLELIPNYDIGWLKLAVCFKQLGDMRMAKTAFKKAVELDPIHSALEKEFNDGH